MKITTKDIEKIVTAYEKLGFIFYEDENVSTRKKAKKQSYVVSYINDNQNCVSKKIDEIKATDIHSAYMHSDKIAESKSENLVNNEAFLLLFNYVTKEDRELINKKITNFLKKNPDYVEEKDFIKSAYYTIDYTKEDENIDNVNSTEIIKEMINGERPIEKKTNEIDEEKIKTLIDAAMKRYETQMTEEEKTVEDTKEEKVEEKVEETVIESVAEEKVEEDKEVVEDKVEENTEEEKVEESTDFILLDYEFDNENTKEEENKNELDIKNKSYYVVSRNNIIQDDLSVVKPSKPASTRDDVIDVDFVEKVQSNEVREETNKPNKNIKVVKVEEDKEVADKARNKSSKDGILVTIGLIFLAGSIMFAANSCSKSRSYSNTKEIVTEDTTDYNDKKETNNEITVEDNTKSEPVKLETTEPVEEEVEEETVEEAIEETVDVHSEDYINKVTDNILTYIQMSGDANLIAKYERDLVDALVRYTHHNYNEYTGDNIITNEIAYEDMSELINHGFDISMFYEGLNNGDNLHALYNATRSLKQEKGNYEDEFKIYACMDAIMNEMNKNNFAEAIALRAYVDNYSVIPSMQMARQQAGVLEMKDTQELWLDVNKDGTKTYDENAEGKGYNDEKAAAMAAKYNEMSSETCKNIYNRISTDDRNSELSIVVFKAIDEDNSFVRTR